MKAVVAYVPIIHRGYIEFFEKHKDSEIVYILDNLLAQEYDPLRKDIRALPSETIKDIVTFLGYNADVANENVLRSINNQMNVVVMPHEDISRKISEKYFDKSIVIFDSIFLMRDKKRTLSKEGIVPDSIVLEEYHRSIMRIAEEESEKSSDWFKRVGAIVVRDGQILLRAHNFHMPSPHTPYALGDPRANFKKGLYIDLSGALHAEASIIAQAASRGDISLRNTNLYVTVFPCPVCARIIAHSRIKRLFFKEGYSMLDGVEIIKSNEIEIIQVK